MQKVMLVDDDEVANLINARLLIRSGYTDRVVQVTKAAEGLEQLRNTQRVEDLPKIIFLDVNMPEMNGWAFLDEFRKLPERFKREIRVFMLSSSQLDRDVVKSKGYKEVEEYLFKPLTEEKIEAIFTHDPKDELLPV